MGGVELRASDAGILISLALAVLAIRLFRTAWSTRKAPELLAGLFLITVPPAVSIAIRLDRLGDSGHVLERIAYLGLGIGGASLALFTWRAFRPASTWARWLGIGLAGVIASGWLVEMALGHSTEATRVAMLRLPGWAASIWLFGESVHHYLLMRRRRRLGLVDPVVANRFMLFAIWTAPFVLLPIFTIGALLVTGESAELGASGPYRAFVRANGLIMIAGIWLSFFPPRAYQRWLRARHGAGAPAEA